MEIDGFGWTWLEVAVGLYANVITGMLAMLYVIGVSIRVTIAATNWIMAGVKTK